MSEDFYICDNGNITFLWNETVQVRWIITRASFSSKETQSPFCTFSTLKDSYMNFISNSFYVLANTGLFFLQICFLQSHSCVCVGFCQPVSLSLQWKDCPKMKECEQQNLVDKRVVYVYCGVWIPGPSLRQEKEKVSVLVKETKKCNRNIKINLQSF